MVSESSPPLFGNARILSDHVSVTLPLDAGSFEDRAIIKTSWEYVPAILREAFLKKNVCFFYKSYKRPLTPPPRFYKVMLRFFLKKDQKVRKRPARQKNA